MIQKIRPMSMQIIISVLLLFTGIAILIIIHVCVVGRVFTGNYITSRLSVSSRTGRVPSLSSDEIGKLPCFDYEVEEKGNSGTPLVCVVCLDNFKEGEKCKKLPLCDHSFHVQCIDSWLLKTGACPICRTRVNVPQKIGEETSHSSEVGVLELS